MLTAEGLVRHEPRRGCFVNEVTEQDLDEIFPGDRAAGRPLRPRGRAQRHRRRPRRRSRRCTTSSNRHAKARRINEYYAANFAIHEAIITLADNRWLAQVIARPAQDRQLARLQQLHAPGRLDQSLSEHLAVFAALKARDAGRRRGRDAHPPARASAKPCANWRAQPAIEAGHERTATGLTRGVELRRARLERRPTRRTREAPRTATLRRSQLAQEALSPRVLRRTLTELQAIVDPQRERSGGRAPRQARRRLVRRRHAGAAARLLAADERAVRARPEEAQGGARAVRGRAGHAGRRRRPRSACAARWCRRARGCCSASPSFPQGMRFLVDLRAELLPHLKADKRLLRAGCRAGAPVLHLVRRRPSSSCGASAGTRPPRCIEKLIKYEAVHDIHSWADLKNRLTATAAATASSTRGCPASR